MAQPQDALPPADGDPASSEAPVDADEAEARERYRELLEELRTILPGVQVLFAFLLTAPFSQRFTELDEFGGDLYGMALIGTALAAAIFLAPASYHRVAPRQARHGRLRAGIRLIVAGMLVLGTSIVIAVFTVMRFIFGPGVGAATAAALAGVMVVLWYGMPLLRRLRLLRP